MKLKGIIRNFPVFTAALLAALVCIALTAMSGEYTLAIFEGIVLLIIIVVTSLSYVVYRKRKQTMLENISKEISFADGKRNAEFPIPVLVTNEKGKFIWYNTAFSDAVIKENDYNEIDDFVKGGMEFLTSSQTKGVKIKCQDKFFSVYSHSRENETVFYFIDNTKLRLIADEFAKTRPAVMLVNIDGVYELQRSYKDSDCSSIRNGVTRIIEGWISQYDCVMTKKADNSFIIVTKTSDVEKMIQRKFDLLDEVRAFRFNDEALNITLSIGIGTDGGVSKSESEAKIALDMALGRGGDQAVVKNKENYSFFGGVSKSVERQTKVKTRIVAGDFVKLVENSNRVIVMGHKSPDLDALGSAAGILAVAKAFEKEAFIATDASSSSSKPLLDYLKDNGFEDNIISVSKAKLLMRKNTLLIITDTHIRSLVESPELLSKASAVAVIDHHRQSIGYIDDTEMFYHDPSASSACELVAQLIAYLPVKIKLEPVVADALLAGIMLDTKSFVFGTGTKTFETAAYLKASGADTVRVKGLFSQSLDEYKIKSEIIASAQIYKGCAISVCKDSSCDRRVVCAQAADELLNIENTDASFVIFKKDNTVNVSARSFGKINVQLVMETLGGGGHQTMAAAQFENEKTDDVLQKVKAAIDNILSRRKT